MAIEINKEIAKISQHPKAVTLSAVPNYIEFEPVGKGSENVIDATLKVESVDLNLEDKTTQKLIIVTEIETNTVYEFYGTNEKKYVGRNTFYVESSHSSAAMNANITAENVKACLMTNSFFASNFELSIPFIKTDEDTLVGGDTIKIISLGASGSYSFKMKTFASVFVAKENEYISSNHDSIDGGKGDVIIELDIYTDTGLSIGEEISPQTSAKGNFLTTIQKAYFRQPLWFNLNSTFGNSTSYSNEFLKNLDVPKWCDAGTAKEFRYVAYRSNGSNKEPFYISDALYVIKGYKRSLEENDLDNYIYDYDKADLVNPLTTQPILNHVKGQKQFFNFIASKSGTTNYTLGITYRLYTQSGMFIAEMANRNQEHRNNFSVVNTITLDIDGVIDGYQNVGIVDAFLSRGNEKVSSALRFHILPECLHKIKDFAFLNALGGWSSYGFMSNQTVDFRASNNTIFKTQTVKSTISSDIESVYNVEVKEQFTVLTMPIKPEVAAWLKEMSASDAVYELSTKRYIIIDEMRIKYSGNDELVRVEMKYRYSDSYNGLI